MHPHRLIALALAALACNSASCGTSSSGIDSRPVETLMYVTGGPGLNFQIASAEDPSNAIPCGDFTGIQAANANHQFPNRTFLTPHLFVFENIHQPVRAVIRNLDPTNPLIVNIFLGLIQQQAATIPPGECQAVISNDTLPLNPKPVGRAVAVELCAPINTQDGTVDLNIPCVGDPVDPPSANIGFFASIGDIKATNITSCTLTGLLDTCLTAATFFIERPQQRVDAVMTVNAGQAPGNGEMRTELYINGERVDQASGGMPIVGKKF